MKTEIRKMPSAEYHADPCDVPSLSASIAKVTVQESLLHAYTIHPKLGGKSKKRTVAMSTGSIVHALLLDNKDDIEVIDAKNFQTKAAQAARDEAEAQGKLAIPATKMNGYEYKVQRIRERMESKGIILDGKNEEAYFWTELSSYDNYEVQCRSMLDHTKPALILDIKTANSVHPKSCSDACWSLAYQIQAVAYTRAYESNNPQFAGRTRFLFVFVETEEPYEVVPIEMSGKFRADGAVKWQEAVNRWAYGLRTGNWPGYTEGDSVLIVDPPGWAKVQDIDYGDSNSDPFDTPILREPNIY